MDEPLASFLTAVDFRQAKLLKRAEQTGVMRPRLAVSAQKFVERRRCL